MLTDFDSCPLPAGVIGLAAVRPDLVRSDWSLELPPADELNALAAAVGLNPDGFLDYPAWGAVPPPARARLTRGLTLTLIGHNKHREWADKRAGTLTDFLHRGGFRPQKSGRVPDLTRGHLPNWQDGGDKFGPCAAWPLLFAPAAVVALPLPSGPHGSAAVLLCPGPVDLRRAGEVVAAGVPRDDADLYPATPADAALSHWLRLDAAGVPLPGVTAYTYRFTPGNANTREVAGVERFDPPAAGRLELWRRAAGEFGVPAGEYGPFPDRVRGLAADNLLAGRPLYAGFEGLCRTAEEFRRSSFGARKLVRLIVGAAA